MLRITNPLPNGTQSVAHTSSPSGAQGTIQLAMTTRSAKAKLSSQLHDLQRPLRSGPTGPNAAGTAGGAEPRKLPFLATVLQQLKHLWFWLLIKHYKANPIFYAHLFCVNSEHVTNNIFAGAIQNPTTSDQSHSLMKEIFIDGNRYTFTTICP